MKASVFYRTASVLLLIFDLGHTYGFRQHDPKWGVETLLSMMQSIHFQAQGFSRSYWDVFVGAGFIVSVFLLFSAVLAWQLAGLAPDTLARLRGTAWAFALSFVAIAILSWKYFFTAPLVFSGLIALCLVGGAWRSGQAK